MKKAMFIVIIAMSVITTGCGVVEKAEVIETVTPIEEIQEVVIVEEIEVVETIEQEEVKAPYVSPEYLAELESNSQSNVF